MRAPRHGIEVHDLPQRMDTAVGSTGAKHAHRVRGYPCECGLEFTLHGTPSGLTLPTAEGPARVLHTECEACDALLWLRR